MKLFGSKRREAVEASGVPGTGHKLERRDVVVGAGVVGAAALAAQVLPTAGTATVAAATPEVAPTAAGYRLTAHVQRYYETTKA